MDKCKCEDKNTDYHYLHCCNAMNDWQSEFRYLLNRKILSKDEMAELFSQIKSVIDRETYELKQQIEKYRCNTGWAKAIELEKELERVNRQRTIEQGAWEEAKKYQDMYIKTVKELEAYKLGG